MEQKLPSDRKMANVMPIQESGAKNCVKTYIPISLARICFNLIEHVIYNNLIAHLNIEGVLFEINTDFVL